MSYNDHFFVRRPSVKFSHFLLLLRNPWGNFNPTRHKFPWMKGIQAFKNKVPHTLLKEYILELAKRYCICKKKNVFSKTIDPKRLGLEWGNNVWGGGVYISTERLIYLNYPISKSDPFSERSVDLSLFKFWSPPKGRMGQQLGCV